MSIGENTYKMEKHFSESARAVCILSATFKYMHLVFHPQILPPPRNTTVIVAASIIIRIEILLLLFLAATDIITTATFTIAIITATTLASERAVESFF